jgi:hypothetical protein
MQDDDTPTTRRPSPTDDETAPDDEPFGDLSKAAREAVRQPADPRLEAQIARLGLSPDAEPPRRPRGRRTEAEPAAGAETERIVEALAATQSATDRLERRVEVLTYVLVALAVVLTILVVVVTVRPAA